MKYTLIWDHPTISEFMVRVPGRVLGSDMVILGNIEISHELISGGFSAQCRNIRGKVVYDGMPTFDIEECVFELLDYVENEYEDNG